MEQLIKFFNALLTPLIAVVTAYIAWQQWKTNKQKLFLEMYDRRLRVYEEVIKFLKTILGDQKTSTEYLLKFRASVSEADFLFESEIPKYIDEIYQHGVDLCRWNAEYRDWDEIKPEGYDHKKVVSEKFKEMKWLSEQFEPAKNKLKNTLT